MTTLGGGAVSYERSIPLSAAKWHPTSGVFLPFSPEMGKSCWERQPVITFDPPIKRQDRTWSAGQDIHRVPMMFFTRHLPDIEHGDREADSSWPSWPDSSWPEASRSRGMHASRVAASLGSTLFELTR